MNPADYVVRISADNSAKENSCTVSWTPKCLYDLRVYLMVFVIGQLQQLFRSCNIKYFFLPVSHSVYLMLAKKNCIGHIWPNSRSRPIFGLYPNLFAALMRSVALCVTAFFWIIQYLRRSLFSQVKIVKSRYRSRPTDEHSKYRLHLLPK
jgi:hypothetical protein